MTLPQNWMQKADVLHKMAGVCGAAAASCRLMFVLECGQSGLEKTNPSHNPPHLKEEGQ